MDKRRTGGFVVLAVLVSAWLAMWVPARAQAPAVTAESLLVVGKAAGACGILDLQLAFQQSTQMAGGNEFVVRFWTTEAARLGMTLPQYATEHCKSSLESYGKLQDLAAQIDRK